MIHIRVWGHDFAQCMALHTFRISFHVAFINGLQIIMLDDDD